MVTDHSTCPHCDGRPTRDLGTWRQYRDGELVATRCQTWTCDLCAGEGKVPRTLAREVWLNPSMTASA